MRLTSYVDVPGRTCLLAESQDQREAGFDAHLSGCRTLESVEQLVGGFRA